MIQTMYCSSCSCEIHEGNYYEVEGDLFCKECYDSETFKCECCEDRFLNDNNCGDDDTMVCRSCFNEEYHRCNCCERVIHDDDTLMKTVNTIISTNTATNLHRFSDAAPTKMQSASVTMVLNWRSMTAARTMTMPKIYFMKLTAVRVKICSTSKRTVHSMTAWSL